MEFKCKCIGSGTGFGGHCGRCGMMKSPITNINTTKRTEEDIKQLILKLQRYSGGWDGIYDDQEGEYINLDDVLKIFGSEEI